MDLEGVKVSFYGGRVMDLEGVKVSIFGGGVMDLEVCWVSRFQILEVGSWILRAAGCQGFIFLRWGHES